MHTQCLFRVLNFIFFHRDIFAFFRIFTKKISINFDFFYNLDTSSGKKNLKYEVKSYLL